MPEVTPETQGVLAPPVCSECKTPLPSKKLSTCTDACQAVRDARIKRERRAAKAREKADAKERREGIRSHALKRGFRNVSRFLAAYEISRTYHDWIVAHGYKGLRPSPTKTIYGEPRERTNEQKLEDAGILEIVRVKKEEGS
jgi:hypothetical protein